MAGIDVDVQVGADEEDFMEGKSKPDNIKIA
jgi:hypothetical protein